MSAEVVVMTAPGRTTAGPRPFRRAGAAVLGTGTLLLLWTLALGLAARGADLPPAIAAATAPGAVWPACAYLVLLAGFTTALINNRRGRSSPGGVSALLISVGVVAAAGGALGLLAYSGCQSDIPVLWHLYWTLELFIGFTIDSTTAATCAVWPSQAIEIARLLTLSALFGGAAAALTVAVRGRYSRTRLALDPWARCFVGVDEQSLPLVAEALRDDGAEGRVYVVDPDPGSVIVTAATALGAIHVEGFGDEPELLRRAVRRPRFRQHRAALGISEFTCLSPDPDTNLALLDALLAAVDADAGGHGAADNPHDRLTVRVRIDEIHRGERWWRQQAQGMSFLNRPYTVDRIGVFDSTARRIALAIRDSAVGRPAVVVDGDNATALAVVKHVAMEANWAAALGGDGEHSPHIVLTGQRAAEIARDAAGLWDLSSVEVTVAGSVPPWSIDRDGLRVDCLFAVLADPDRGGSLVGERVAERLLASAVWVVHNVGSPLEVVRWVTGDAKRRDQGVGGGAVRSEPLILRRSAGDRDSTWERAAWHVARFRDPAAAPGTYSPRDLRDVLSVGALVRDSGLVWGPPHRAWRAGLCCDGGARGGAHESDCLFEALCRTDSGDGDLGDGDLGDGDLGDGGEAGGIAAELEHVLDTLRILGLSPWFPVTRSGTLERAERLTQPLSFETRRGLQRGVAGDWLVTDSGVRWIESHEGFVATFAVTAPYSSEYTHLRRIPGGDMWARRAAPGETVSFRGATSVAEDGDWVLREGAAQWVVPRASFQRGYSLTLRSDQNGRRR